MSLGKPDLFAKVPPDAGISSVRPRGARLAVAGDALRFDAAAGEALRFGGMARNGVHSVCGLRCFHVRVNGSKKVAKKQNI